MSEPFDAESKIKLVKHTYKRLEKQILEFDLLDRELKESEFYLDIALKELKSDYDKAVTFHDEIVLELEEKDKILESYLKSDYFGKLRNLYLKHSTKIQGILKSLTSTGQNVTVSEAFQNINSTFLPQDNFNLTLASLDIPEFDGNYEKWPDFRDAMESSVNNISGFTNVTKLKILQKYLKGDALKVIKRGKIKLLGANYEKLWELLTKRYNHRRSLVNSYFHLLFYQDVIEKENSSNIKRLYDTTYDALTSLSSLDLEVENWGDILLFLVHSKLPLKTKEQWDEKLGKSDELPKFEDFMEFLEARFRTLESIEVTRNTSDFTSRPKKFNNFKRTSLQTFKNDSKSDSKSKKEKKVQFKTKCKYCQENSHYSLYWCKKFQDISPQERIKVANNFKCCYNCLSYYHLLDKCESDRKCATCGFRHHSLLHLDSKLTYAPKNKSSETNLENQESTVNREAPSTSANATKQTLVSNSEENICFPTALVKITHKHGSAMVFRALVDACSDLSYISENAVNRLNLKKQPTFVETSGLNNSSTGSSKFYVSIELLSIHDGSFSLSFRAYVVPEICEKRPTSQFSISELLPAEIELADPKFNLPGRIDLLLGGAIDSQISLEKILKSQCGKIVFKETKLGYIANGLVPAKRCFITSFNSNDEKEVMRDLDQTLRNFWELEELQDSRSLTVDELKAEENYVQNTKRLPSGHYMVSLPFKTKRSKFVNMKKIAYCRLSYLEKKLEKNLKLKKEYHQVINEYITLGHMKEVNSSEISDGYYLPHHSVLKEESTTTKLRVVFDASARDSNLTSLNENLLTGPRLQADLLDLLIKFRTFRFAVTADIEKMYRQIFINPNDERYHLILWRNEMSQEIKTYSMNRVTFGTSPAPFLAVRTLYKLADDEEENFPIGAKCLRDGFYVDDFLYGADTLDEAREIQKQTISILQSANFNLRKWSANSPKLLQAIPEADRETKTLLSFEDNLSIKTLGIRWSPLEDNFHFQTELTDHLVHTKRTTLSDIAKIFDPLGWVAPCVILAKILMQDIWSEKLEWDDPLPTEILERWLKLRNEFVNISKIKVPRWLKTVYSDGTIELHGFADASEKAYAAQIYLKTFADGKVDVNLLLSKTRVAPLKRLTIPRLELCAATLLAKLVNHVEKVLKIRNLKINCWSDSTIVLAWIRDSPQKRTTYVANRVTEIQTLTNSNDWHHVGTKENPADLSSRGLFPSELKDNSLWWHGPQFLKNYTVNYDKFENSNEVKLPSEEDKQIKPCKKVVTSNLLTTLMSNGKSNLIEISANYNYFENTILNKFSTLSKLCRVVAYCRRMLKSNRYLEKHITPQEYENALKSVIRMVQFSTFGEEISIIQEGKSLPKSSNLCSLNPFINKTDNLLRMDSRLASATHLPYDQKFPIILPYNHVLSELIVLNSHITTMHGTIQGTMMHICQKFHIIRCKHLVRKIYNRCVICFRFRSKSLQQRMGQLPIHRITPDRPFSNCGVDFAGPFEIKMWKGRCKKFHKSHFAIFVCFATKAVHLEAVVDLSTAAFVASYRRFIARRGLAKHIYSDCGTNFVGSQKVITRSAEDCAKNWNEEIAQELSELQATWHFNPPSAPHFGGLWEAGVKSVKHHLKRIVGSARLTYDEFETLLLQIESCLNSRPLTKLDNNPDSVILTPGHFLIGNALNALPDHNLKEVKISFSDRWNYIQHLFQEFWRFWSKDYLNMLRERGKWKSGKENLNVNDIVLIKDDNLPPNSWLKARVLEVHPDSKGLVRVATVKTQNNVLKRPIVKLAPLPNQN